MPILQIKTDFVGQLSVNPRLVRIVTNDDLATVTSLNWLKQAEANGYTIYPTDFIAVAYSGGSAWFNPSIDINGNITLVANDNPGGAIVSGPVTIGDLVKFVGANTVSDVGYKILFGTSSQFAGGGTTFSFSVPGATINSISLVAMKNQTNSASITSFGTVADQINVTFSADPGASTLVNYVTFVPNA